MNEKEDADLFSLHFKSCESGILALSLVFMSKREGKKDILSLHLHCIAFHPFYREYDSRVSIFFKKKT